jgi:hypothetical protein
MMINRKPKQMIKLVQVDFDEGSGHYHLREIVVNSLHIVSMVYDDYHAALHANGRLPEGLHEAQQFSKIMLTNGKEIIAVGSPDTINLKAKKILHG